MKTVSLNKKSWHYKMMDSFGFTHRDADFCEYLRGVLLCLVIVLVLSVLAIIVVGSYGETIGWIVAMIATGGWIEPSGLTSPAFVTTIIVVVGGLLYWQHMAKEKRETKIFQERMEMYKRGEISYREIENYAKEPGFFALAYRKIKDKTCFKVKFV